MRKKTLKILALLQIILLLGGCATGDAANQEIAEEPLGEDVRFEDIAYVRPELERFETAAAELEEALGKLSLPSTLSKLIGECYACYYHYDTMYTLAHIRSCQDVTDEYYAGEWDWCSENYPQVQQMMDDVYVLCAQSRYGPILERLYFWEGFVEEYGGSGDEGAYPDEVYELFRQENRLLAQYRALTADPIIELDGQSLSLEEYILTADSEEYLRAVAAYYDQYNERLCNIYTELIKLRRAQAEALGYDSYEQMQYAYTFERDYTPRQAAGYFADIRRYLAPYYRQVMKKNGYGTVDWGYLPEQQLHDILAAAAERMGGGIAESFDYMDSRGLYDIRLDYRKANISFQTYLADYEAPFLFLDACGDNSDILNFAHEFGHYADTYVNGNAYETTDLAESFSQAMEYLISFYLGDSLDVEDREELLRIEAMDTLSMYCQQAALAEFESRVYALPEEELSCEKINALYLSTALDYGVMDAWSMAADAKGWIDVPHLFESPFYVVSYPVTNDIAMQIFALEEEKAGQGLEKYREMLSRESGALMPAVESAGLQSPFTPGRIQQVLTCLREILDQDGAKF